MVGLRKASMSRVHLVFAIVRRRWRHQYSSRQQRTWRIMAVRRYIWPPIPAPIPAQIGVEVDAMADREASVPVIKRGRLDISRLHAGKAIREQGYDDLVTKEPARVLKSHFRLI